MRTVAWMVAVALLGGGAGGTVASAGGLAQDFALATLEELMNVRITSASRKEQSIGDTAAAVYVISSEDIRRSGATTLPDVLRLAPGIQVLRLDSNKWAVSARGIGSVYSHMLLVLVDGRSVYNRGLATVPWDVQDLVFEDIDRIEVIRGPGASVWGANAVNGVVNIITKPPSATQGTLVQLQGATLDGVGLTARHGGRLAGGDYRVHLQQSNRRGLVGRDGRHGDDDWNVLSGGFRLDWEQPARSHVSLQGGALTNDAGTVGAPRSSSDTQHLLATAVRQLPHDAQVTFQGFISREHRRDPLARDLTTTFDVDLQYHAQFARRNDSVIGVGYRRIGNTFDLVRPFRVASPHVNDAVLNLYAQHELGLADNRLRVTVGTKLEHDSTAGFGLQPTGRVLWALPAQQQVWAAVSRALHTPGRLVRDLEFDLPPVQDPTTGIFVSGQGFGNPNLQYEKAVSREIGYRVALHDDVSVDVAAFLNTYRDMLIWQYRLAGFSLTPIPLLHYTFQVGNTLAYDTRGIELVTRWAPRSNWQVEGSYSWVDVDRDFDLESAFLAADDAVPAHAVTVRSRLSLGTRLGVDASMTRVAPMSANPLFGPYSEAVPAYTRVDANAEWRLHPTLSLALTGHNLLGSHVEATGTLGFAYTLDPTPRTPLSVSRNVGARLHWRF